MTMTTNKQALREAAEKAAPGKWRYLKTTPFMDAEISSENHTRVVNLLASDVTADNSEFIAAANPATVLALLDELEAAEKRIAELEALDKPKFVQCWSCKHDIEVLAIADCDGYCPRCAAPIDLDDEPYAAAGKGE